jgi:hypothetical protein
VAGSSDRYTNALVSRRVYRRASPRPASLDAADSLGYNMSVGLLRSGQDQRPKGRSQLTLWLWLAVVFVLVAWIATLMLR